MSDKINTGGPAFPSGDGQWSGGTNHVYGMSLRDWFAGQAMAGLWANGHDQVIELAGDFEQTASSCYQMADAMLAAREAK